MPKDEEGTRTENERLEELWGGEFGDAYVDRNAKAGDVRRPFWQAILDEYPCSSVLEVGCNLGANLRWVAERLPANRAYGVDVNGRALEQIRASLPGVNSVWSPARSLPFRDGWFDLVFTMGVLIHQPDSTLPLVMSEMVRCSRRFVICGEYYAEEPTGISYRGVEGALFKRDYGRLFREMFPELRCLKQGFLGRAEGWDDVTYWVFEKFGS